MDNQIWWYAARSGGLLAWALLAASVLWGLALTTRVSARRTRPAWLLDLHRFLGGAALVFTAIHVVAIMADSYVGFGLAEILVPFTGTWHPAAVAWGIVGLYLLAALEVTSLLRARIPATALAPDALPQLPVFVTTTVHALTAGTDRHNPLIVGGVAAACAAVTTLTALRLARSGQPARGAGAGHQVASVGGTPAGR